MSVLHSVWRLKQPRHHSIWKVHTSVTWLASVMCRSFYSFCTPWGKLCKAFLKYTIRTLCCMFILAKARSKICTLLPSFTYLFLKGMNTESSVICALYIYIYAQILWHISLIVPNKEENRDWTESGSNVFYFLMCWIWLLSSHFISFSWYLNEQ